jgi:hypothetical protein
MPPRQEMIPGTQEHFLPPLSRAGLLAVAEQLDGPLGLVEGSLEAIRPAGPGEPAYLLTLHLDGAAEALHKAQEDLRAAAEVREGWGHV